MQSFFNLFSSDSFELLGEVINVGLDFFEISDCDLMILDCRPKHRFGLFPEPRIFFNYLKSLLIVILNALQNLIPKFVSSLNQMEVSFVALFENFVFEIHFIFVIGLHLRKIIHIKLF